MKLITLLGVAFLVAILVFFLPKTIEEYNVRKSQKTVTVKVTELPDCSFGYKHKFIHFSYNGRTYTKRTKCKYVKSLTVGQQIPMYHKPDTEIFLFPSENVISELGATILLAVLMTVCVCVLLLKQWKKTPNAHNKSIAASGA